MHEREPAVFLVESRVLRRVIKLDRQIAGYGLQVPHRKSYVVGRAQLLDFVEADELTPRETIPETVILLPLPETETFSERSAEEILLGYWRLLFHARVHVEMDRRLESQALTPAAVRRQVHRIGQSQFDEIRAVLYSEDMLLPPRRDPSVYVEFAAVYFELAHFDPELLPQYFPTIIDPKAVEEILSEDVDAAAILEQTRPEGLGVTSPAALSRDADAASRSAWLASPEVGQRFNDGAIDKPSLQIEIPPAGEPTTSEPTRPSPRELSRYVRLVAAAERTETAGNLVRGAIFRMRAASVASGDAADESLAAAHADIGRLLDRLQQALQLSHDELAIWRNALRELLVRCRDDRLTTEGRLLYDLQKVCIDHEREIFTVDVSEWVLSWGKKPIHRPLPAQREVLISKHLRSAARRLASAQLSTKARDALRSHMHDALERADDNVRERMRPQIAAALNAVGISPTNLPEEVAENKIIEQLLDKVVESGYLRFGDLRDAVSRNQLKLPDLVTRHTPSHWEAAARAWVNRRFPKLRVRATGGDVSSLPARLLLMFWFAVAFLGSALRQVFFGDHLLAADAQLASRLDGVYRRAEIYLRFFQRFTSLGFGSRLGRFLSCYFLLPVLAAFVVIVFFQEMSGIVSRWMWPPTEDKDHALPIIEAMLHVFRGDGSWRVARDFPMSIASSVILTLLFLGLINSATFRRLSMRLLKAIGNAVYQAVELLADWLARPLIQTVLHNRWFVLARRYLLKPLLATLVVWLVLMITGWTVGLDALVAIFLAMNLVLNSRIGRNVEEIGNEWIVRNWDSFRTRVLAGLYFLVIDFFKVLLERVDRVIYAVDEWLRFRQGETTLTFVGKAVLGSIWYVVTYIVRFAILVLLEPQINPIKHFPVVTVSHKVIWSLALVMAPTVSHLTGWTKEASYGILSLLAFCIPGAFGFLVWELKENWKLYRANRPAELQPAIIGHHGETMIRFMRPGIHSGTLPKLFRRIRRAYRKARRARRPTEPLARKHFDQLEHVRHSLVHFFERELLFLLDRSPAWSHALSIGKVQLGSNRMAIEIRAPGLAASPGANLAGADGEPRGEETTSDEDASCWFSFEEQSRWLVAGICRTGWIDQLGREDRLVFRNAVVGLYKRTGAHLLHQQVEAILPEPNTPYDVAHEGLVLWPGNGYETEVVYNLEDEGTIRPRVTLGQFTEPMPRIRREDVLFSQQPVSWNAWIAVWSDAAGPRQPLLDGVPVLRREA